jgi:hypothetical protein
MITVLACACALPSCVFAFFAFGWPFGVCALWFLAFGWPCLFAFFAFGLPFGVGGVCGCSCSFVGAFALCRVKSIELLLFAPARIIFANPSTTAGPAPGHMNIYELISMQQTNAALHDQLWK